MATARAHTLEIEIRLIDIGEQQVRETPDDDSIGELAESIAAKGLLQPIGVTNGKEGRYQLRWGHRRVLAHQRLNKPTIKATVYDGDEKSIKGLALVENLHRAQMTMAEEVETVRYLTEEEGKTIEQISAITNKSRAWVLNRLMVPDLPDFMAEPLLAGHLPLSHIEIISRVPDPGAQRYLVAQCLQNTWNSSALRTIAECYMHPETITQPGITNTPGVNPNPILAPFFYTCEACGEKGELHEFTLVRVHKDGCRSDAIDARSDRQGDRNPRLESDADGHQRPDAKSHHRKTKARRR